MSNEKSWTPLRVAALSASEAKVLKQNALERFRFDIVKLCDLRLTLGSAAMQRQYREARLTNSWPPATALVSFVGQQKGLTRTTSTLMTARASKKTRGSDLTPIRKPSQQRPLDAKLLQIQMLSKQPAEWSTKLGSGGSVSGTEYSYVVTDKNFAKNNEWITVVQVPLGRRSAEGIIIRLLDRASCPKRSSVDKHSIWRKSIVFMPTTTGNHLGKSYAKVFETQGGASKSIKKRGERSSMHEWLQSSYFASWMRLKGTIATSNASDLEHQVLLANTDDHIRMIRTFFALRVWNLL